MMVYVFQARIRQRVITLIPCNQSLLPGVGLLPYGMGQQATGWAHTQCRGNLSEVREREGEKVNPYNMEIYYVHTDSYACIYIHVYIIAERLSARHLILLYCRFAFVCIFVCPSRFSAHARFVRTPGRPDIKYYFVYSRARILTPCTLLQSQVVPVTLQSLVSSQRSG